MIRYAVRRLVVTIPILLVISFATFWAAGEISSPTAQLTLNPRISPEAKQAYIESLGLDKPFLVQYLKWLGNFVTGDLGTSLVKNGQDVWPFIERALANTLLLVAIAVAFSLFAGITIGAISAIDGSRYAAGRKSRVRLWLHASAGRRRRRQAGGCGRATGRLR